MPRIESKVHPWEKLFPSPWPAIWTTIYLAILLLGLIAPHNDLSTFVKLGGIILCLLYVLHYFRSDFLLQLAMFITCIADIILALNNTATSGVACFFCVQIVHLFRLSDKSHYLKVRLFTFLSVAIIILNFFLKILPSIYVICGFYVIAISSNIFLSWHWFKTSAKTPRAFFAFLGFILFLCCDTCTGISYLSLNHYFPSLLYDPANFFAWIFYYPSQILVSNSSKYDKMVTKGR